MRDTRGRFVDRMLALLLLVQKGRPLPERSALAKRHRVHVRTISRDFQALRRAGLAVQTAERWEWA